MRVKFKLGSGSREIVLLEFHHPAYEAFSTSLTFVCQKVGITQEGDYLIICFNYIYLLLGRSRQMLADQVSFTNTLIQHSRLLCR